MIVSENVKLNIKTQFNNVDIERKLREFGIEPLRWAITACDDKSLSVNVSYVKES